MAEEVFVFPLSFAQQRLWFLDQVAPGNPFYNIHDAIPVAAPLDVAAMERSINEVARRHEILRTIFASVDGRPVQVVMTSLSLPLPVRDLSGLPGPEREAEAARISAEEAQRPFDLTRGPLLRITLLRLGEEEDILLLTMHHIISDGRSIEVLVRELSMLYDAFCVGQPSPLPELPIQYADFSVWQREWLRGEVLQAQLGYWRKQLAGAPTVLALPTDRPRPPVQTFRGATQGLELSAQLSAQVEALGRREGATLFMTLLAAFKILLFRYTGQDDIIVGAPIAGRGRTELEGLVGFFVNTLALRTCLTGDPSFRELLRRVRESALGAYAHQDLPFEKLVEELHPERDTSRNPLFQVMFALQNVTKEVEDRPGYDLPADETPAHHRQIERGAAKFDLALAVQEGEGGVLSGCLEYSTDLFNDETIARMIGHFQRLLEGAVADPDQSISALPILTAAEQSRLLGEWGRARADYPQDSCVHDLFEAQVKRTPDAVAVVFGDQQLTYAEVNGRANQLARRLRAMGVGPEVTVGICLERSVEMVVGLLGILKAGGAYVPLDPGYPPERLAFMLRDAGVSVLLTQEQFVGALPKSGARVLRIDTEWETIAAEAHEGEESGATADNLAYVIYTSGSTGQPKGVLIPHRAIIRLVCNTNYVRLEEGGHVAQASNSSFDAATFEIWGPLLHGARLVGIPKAVLLSPQHLAAELREKRISVLFLTTALFNQLAGDLPGVFSSVRDLLFGGEAVDPRRVKEVLRAGPPERLLHVYGPTESTTFATWSLVEDLPAEAITVPIGRPIANTEVYLLDASMRPVPVGVTGEIYLGGAGLARGYLGRPELTAERFVPDPWGGEGGGRLYRTGDLGRYRAGGEVDYLGRRDGQVKVRGHRVEVGEVEAVLGEHGGVREAVVVAREAEPGDLRLVAFLAWAGQPPEDAAAAIAEVRRWLRRKLPQYMVPSAFVPLDKLPRTPNGKVDRRALPSDAGAVLPKSENPAPRCELEQRVAAIWKEVLGVAQVGVDDNFFDLGGHSLLLIRVHRRLREAAMPEITIVDLFRYPTVRRLAEYIRARQQVTSGAVEEALEMA